MNIIFITDNDDNYSSPFTDEIKELKKLNYNVIIVNNYKETHQYKDIEFIIIDLEYNNKTGDVVSKYIKNYHKNKPIIGIYSFYKYRPIKYNYNLIYFNYLTSIPVLNWENILDNSKNKMLYNFDDNNSFTKYITKELQVTNMIYKNIIGKNPIRRKI